MSISFLEILENFIDALFTRMYYQVEVMIMKQSLMPSILKAKRNELQMSPDDVVKALQERGFSISVKTLYAYEAGTNLPKVTTFLALCDIYGISDVMGCFGYSPALCTPENDWSIDQYNDFFNAPLLDKLYLLIRWHIPSFSGYEAQLDKLLPSDQEKYNFDKLYNLFMQLDETRQGRLLERAELLLEESQQEKARNASINTKTG